MIGLYLPAIKQFIQKTFTGSKKKSLVIIILLKLFSIFFI